MQPTAGQRRRLITISIPVFNEEANIAALLAALRALAAKHEGQYDFEFLFTDNASSDKTFELLLEASASDPRIRILRFSRNFGFQRSILTNYLNARGDAAVQIDADLQDPPDFISDLLAGWEQGYMVVYGIRRRRKESLAVELMRKMFYRFVTRISDVPIPVDAGDFRLIDRKIIEHLRLVSDRNPYLRGLIASFGYPQKGIEYDREARFAGKTKFNGLRLVNLGIDGITSQSTQPLHFITLFGFGLSFLTIILIGIYLLVFIFGGTIAPFRGFMTLVLLMLFSIGMNAFLLGVMGEYIGRIFHNVRGHPMIIVEKSAEHGNERPSGG